MSAGPITRSARLPLPLPLPLPCTGSRSTITPASASASASSRLSPLSYCKRKHCCKASSSSSCQKPRWVRNGKRASVAQLMSIMAKRSRITMHTKSHLSRWVFSFMSDCFSAAIASILTSASARAAATASILTSALARAAAQSGSLGQSGSLATPCQPPWA